MLLEYLKNFLKGEIIYETKIYYWHVVTISLNDKWL